MPAPVHARDFLLQRVPQGSKLALDTNILVQLCDQSHTWHASTRRFLLEAQETKAASLHYFLATKLETLEYFRRKGLTRYFREFYQGGRSVGGSNTFDMKYSRHPLILAPLDHWESLDDRDVKQIRRDFLEDYEAANQSADKAQAYWNQICVLALQKHMRDVGKILDQHGLVYAGLQDKELFPSDSERPSWQKQEDYMIRYAMGSNDASIVNMAASAQGIHGILTNDLDILEFVRVAKEAEHLIAYTFIDRYVARSAPKRVKKST